MKIIKTSNYDYESWDDEESYMDEGAESKAWDLARDSDINILSDKSLKDIEYVGEEVAGALFDSWDGDVYSFDVVVDPKFQRQGIGTNLTESAINWFNMESEAFEDPKINVDVVSPVMKKILLNKGFKVIDNFDGHEYMSL
jgi:GNAT superfamily N-acetyltransferase